MSTYHANAVRSGKWWAVEVAEVPGVLTQGRNLVDAARMAREAVALVLDTDEAEVTIKLEPQLPVEVLAAVTDFQKRRSAREEAEAAERAAQQAAARALVGAGLTGRDAGTVLGMSHQRIAQLAPGALKAEAVSGPRVGSTKARPSRKRRPPEINPRTVAAAPWTGRSASDGEHIPRSA